MAPKGTDKPLQARNRKSKAEVSDAIPESERLYQFKIALVGAEPPIWRRIQAKDGKLDQLHEAIQLAMGWTNSHLHQFVIAGKVYGDPDLLEELMEECAAENSLMPTVGATLPRLG